MERAWLRTVRPTTRASFMATRFMDDVLLVYAENRHTRSLVDELKGCYHKPLKLEPAKPGTFLETTYDLGNGDDPEAGIRFWLKNDNAEHTTVWRYQHFHSYATFAQKRATLTACLRRVQRMASEPQVMRYSAIAKLAEFAKLGYPHTLLRKACTFLAATSGNGTWISVRNTIGTTVTVQRPVAGEQLISCSRMVMALTSPAAEAHVTHERHMRLRRPTARPERGFQHGEKRDRPF